MVIDFSKLGNLAAGIFQPGTQMSPKPKDGGNSKSSTHNRPSPIFATLPNKSQRTGAPRGNGFSAGTQPPDRPDPTEVPVGEDSSTSEVPTTPVVDIDPTTGLRRQAPLATSQSTLTTLDQIMIGPTFLYVSVPLLSILSTLYVVAMIYSQKDEFDLSLQNPAIAEAMPAYEKYYR